MENINQYSETILALLKDKDFSSLSADERIMVKAFLDEELYVKHRETYSSLAAAEKRFVNGLEPRQLTQKKLLHALRKREENAGFWAGVSGYKIPVWQAAAAVLLVLFSFLLMQNTSEGNAATNLVTITDTVKVVKQEVEKILVYDTVYWKEKPSRTKKTKGTGIIVVDNHKQNSEASPVRPLNLDGLSVLSLENRSAVQPSGNSLSDDTLVNKFNFVTIN